MTTLRRYLAEEVAADHADGLLTRREALHRLALLGIGATTAASLIAACGGQRKPTTRATATTVTAPPPGTVTAQPTEAVSWPGPHGPLLGAWAPPSDARGAVLVIHENKGLGDWVRSVTGRLAGAGYSALAIDLLSAEGGSGKFPDPAQAMAALAALPADRLIADLKSGVTELQRRVAGRKVAVLGFCFGGGLVWELLAAGEPRLSVAVPFYGPLPDDPDFTGSRAAVLGIYAALDDRVTAAMPAAKAALDRAGLVSELIVEADADHAFFNDTGPRYQPVAAADAWRRTLAWFGHYLA